MKFSRRSLLGTAPIAVGGAMLASAPGMAAPGPAQGKAPAAVRASRYDGPILDSHLHLISSDEKRFPRVPGTKTGGGGARNGGVRVLPTAVDALKWMAENGVERGLAVQKKSAYGFDNRYTLDAVDVLPEKFAAVVVIDTEKEETPQLLSSLVSAHNVLGLRLTGARDEAGAMPWLDSDVAQKTWRRAADLELAVDLMAMPPLYDASTLERFAALAKKYPKARLVLDHVGWPVVDKGVAGAITDMHLRLRDLGNVFFKLTTVNLDLIEDSGLSTTEFVSAAAGKLGVDRLMWGSDLGNSAGSYAEMLGRMLLAAEGLDMAQHRQVLHDTAATVFRF